MRWHDAASPSFGGLDDADKSSRPLSTYCRPDVSNARALISRISLSSEAFNLGDDAEMPCELGYTGDPGIASTPPLDGGHGGPHTRAVTPAVGQALSRNATILRGLTPAEARPNGAHGRRHGRGSITPISLLVSLMSVSLSQSGGRRTSVKFGLSATADAAFTASAGRVPYSRATEVDCSEPFRPSRERLNHGI